MIFNTSYPSYLGGLPVACALGAMPIQMPLWHHSSGEPNQPHHQNKNQGQQTQQTTENPATRLPSRPRLSPSKAMIMDHVFAERGDDAFVASQDAAGVRWAELSGFNNIQIHEFQMLLDLMKPILIKPSKIVGAREIAKGSFGTIYAAKFNEMKVAIKRINFDGSAAKMHEAYLELYIMKGLSHPNVLQLVGVSADFKNDKSVYFGIVLELCNDTLQRNMQKKKWSFAERMTMALELVHGVSYIHSKSVVHRDLSSQNILLTHQGHIKIADFGCARKVNERGEYKTSSISGSPAYMAPEQLEGQVLTLKCDVWAVGVNLWELATQKLPWADEAMRESSTRLADYEYMRCAVHAGRKMSRPGAGQLNASVADAYYQLILSCHHKDASSRPSARKLLSSLQDILAASSDVNLKRAIHISKEMQRFFAAPSGSNGDGEATPSYKPSSVTRRKVILGYQDFTRSKKEQRNRYLVTDLFKFYSVHDPEKMYDVPQLAESFHDKQDELNENLMKLYNADLNIFEHSAVLGEYF